MEDLFKLTGRLVNADGKGLGGVMLAIVDEDSMDEDDLIGVGMTTEGGHFHVTFLGSEFRQDTLEMEVTPDIKLVASALFDGIYKAVWQRAFPELPWDWEGGQVDMGDVVVEGFDPASPVALEGVEPFPGYERHTERLEIDDDMVRYCMAEVAPIVEKLTGWSNLLDGLNVAVTDGTSGYAMLDSFEAQGIDPESFTAKVMVFIANRMMTPGMGCALYEPGTHTLVINRSVMEQAGLDALKIMVGHELVHVGQFKYTPGLRAYQKAMVAKSAAENADGTKAPDTEVLQARFAFFVELEGYAKYIESDFLHKRYYPMATLFYHASFMDNFIHAIVSALTPGAEETTKVKSSQYTDGLERYRKRQVGDHPVRFELDVASLPGGAQYVP